jgi:hypothetical protein
MTRYTLKYYGTRRLLWKMISLHCSDNWNIRSNIIILTAVVAWLIHMKCYHLPRRSLRSEWLWKWRQAAAHQAWLQLCSLSHRVRSCTRRSLDSRSHWSTQSSRRLLATARPHVTGKQVYLLHWRLRVAALLPLCHIPSKRCLRRPVIQVGCGIHTFMPAQLWPTTRNILNTLATRVK